MHQIGGLGQQQKARDDQDTVAHGDDKRSRTRQNSGSYYDGDSEQVKRGEVYHLETTATAGNSSKYGCIDQHDKEDTRRGCPAGMIEGGAYDKANKSERDDCGGRRRA
jgi:hypothetical protein